MKFDVKIFIKYDTYPQTHFDWIYKATSLVSSRNASLIPYAVSRWRRILLVHLSYSYVYFCFYHRNSVVSGNHTVPVLTRPLNEELQEELSEKTVSDVLRHNIWNSYTKMVRQRCSICNIHAKIVGNLCFHSIHRLNA